MVHYPTHVRTAFLDWVSEGFPETATVEENYEPREVGADEMLRMFLLPAGCTDVMPADFCAAVGEQCGYYGDPRGLSYAIAASALLVQRAAGDSASSAFLERLLGPEVVAR